MTPKKGICKDCAPGTPPRYLTAGRCEFHYKKHRATVNAKKPHNKKTQSRKAELAVYFASQILEIPTCCENCGADIRYQKQINPRALVAHILPKRPNGGFPTVATHPKNRFFGCFDCHTNYDQKGAAFAATMPALPLIRARFNEFKSLLTEAEMQRVPDFLKD